MYEKQLGPRALEALKAVRALRRLPTDTTAAQTRALTLAFRQINLTEQKYLALALEADEAGGQNRGPRG